MRAFTVLLVSALAGCASGGPVPMGGGVYGLTKLSAGCGFASGEGAKIDLYREAAEFCAARGGEVETVTATARDGVPFVRCANAELQFRCAAPTSKR